MEKERKRKEKNRKIEKIYCIERKRVLMLGNTRKEKGHRRLNMTLRRKEVGDRSERKGKERGKNRGYIILRTK